MSDVQQLRSRRRYRALLRETHDLEQRGQKDETVILELQKLEHEYPFLKEIRGPEKEISSMSFNNTMSEGKEKQSCDNASQSNLIASNSPAPVGDISVGLSMASQPLSYDDSKQRSSDVQKNDRQEIGRSLRLGVGFVFCTLSIWNEAHLPSSLSISSYLMILASTIGSAIFHIHGVDPYAMLGRLISPVLFTALIHLCTLISVHLKTPGRISKTFLLLYFVFDFLPSLVFVFVVYILACMCINYVCHSL